MSKRVFEALGLIHLIFSRELETEAVTVRVEYTTPCVTQIVTVCDPGKGETRREILGSNAL